jgi:hypothetical protein
MEFTCSKFGHRSKIFNREHLKITNLMLLENYRISSATKDLSGSGANHSEIALTIPKKYFFRSKIFFFNLPLSNIASKRSTLSRVFLTIGNILRFRIAGLRSMFAFRSS